MPPDYTVSELLNALRASGIEKGDTVFSHSNLGFFGSLEGAENEEDYSAMVYGAIRDVIGPSGTFVVPTFTYSFMDGDVFDPAVTVSDMGILSEYVRTHPESVRSVDPNFSVAAIGPNATYLTENLPSHSFGKNSFWERFLAVRGKFCNLNFDAASTFIHYAERCIDVPYRWDKPFSGIIRQNDSNEQRVFYHFVRDLGTKAHSPDLASFDERASMNGVVNRVDLGKGQIVTITAQDTYDVVESGYLEDPAFLVSGEL